MHRFLFHQLCPHGLAELFPSSIFQNNTAMSAISNSISKKSSGIENSMLSILFIAGLLGAFYFLRQPSELQDGASRIDYASLAMKDTPAGADAYLFIEGAMEKGIPVRFSIPAYNEQVRYVLDLGNGVRMEMTAPEAEYAYRRSGVYKVKLMAEYQGSKKLLHTETLYIGEDSEVAGF